MTNDNGLNYRTTRTHPTIKRALTRIEALERAIYQTAHTKQLTNSFSNERPVTQALRQQADDLASSYSLDPWDDLQPYYWAARRRLRTWHTLYANQPTCYQYPKLRRHIQNATQTARECIREKAQRQPELVNNPNLIKRYLRTYSQLTKLKPHHSPEQLLWIDQQRLKYPIVYRQNPKLIDQLADLSQNGKLINDQDLPSIHQLTLSTDDCKSYQALNHPWRIWFQAQLALADGSKRTYISDQSQLERQKRLILANWTYQKKLFNQWQLIAKDRLQKHTLSSAVRQTEDALAQARHLNSLQAMHPYCPKRRQLYHHGLEGLFYSVLYSYQTIYDQWALCRISHKMITNLLIQPVKWLLYDRTPLLRWAGDIVRYLVQIARWVFYGWQPGRQAVHTLNPDTLYSAQKLKRVQQLCERYANHPQAQVDLKTINQHIQSFFQRHQPSSNQAQKTEQSHHFQADYQKLSATIQQTLLKLRVDHKLPTPLKEHINTELLTRYQRAQSNQQNQLLRDALHQPTQQDSKQTQPSDSPPQCNDGHDNALSELYQQLGNHYLQQTNKWLSRGGLLCLVASKLPKALIERFGLDKDVLALLFEIKKSRGLAVINQLTEQLRADDLTSLVRTCHQIFATYQQYCLGTDENGVYSDERYNQDTEKLKRLKTRLSRVISKYNQPRRIFRLKHLAKGLLDKADAHDLARIKWHCGYNDQYLILPTADFDEFQVLEDQLKRLQAHRNHINYQHYLNRLQAIRNKIATYNAGLNGITYHERVLKRIQAVQKRRDHHHKLKKDLNLRNLFISTLVALGQAGLCVSFTAMVAPVLMTNPFGIGLLAVIYIGAFIANSVLFIATGKTSQQAIFLNQSYHYHPSTGHKLQPLTRKLIRISVLTSFAAGFTLAALSFDKNLFLIFTVLTSLGVVSGAANPAHLPLVLILASILGIFAFAVFQRFNFYTFIEKGIQLDQIKSISRYVSRAIPRYFARFTLQRYFNKPWNLASNAERTATLLLAPIHLLFDIGLRSIAMGLTMISSLIVELFTVNPSTHKVFTGIVSVVAPTLNTIAYKAIHYFALVMTVNTVIGDFGFDSNMMVQVTSSSLQSIYSMFSQLKEGLKRASVFLHCHWQGRDVSHIKPGTPFLQFWEELTSFTVISIPVNLIRFVFNACKSGYLSTQKALSIKKTKTTNATNQLNSSIDWSALDIINNSQNLLNKLMRSSGLIAAIIYAVTFALQGNMADTQKVIVNNFRVPYGQPSHGLATTSAFFPAFTGASLQLGELTADIGDQAAPPDNSPYSQNEPKMVTNNPHEGITTATQNDQTPNTPGTTSNCETPQNPSHSLTDDINTTTANDSLIIYQHDTQTQNTEPNSQKANLPAQSTRSLTHLFWQSYTSKMPGQKSYIQNKIEQDNKSWQSHL